MPRLLTCVVVLCLAGCDLFAGRFGTAAAVKGAPDRTLAAQTSPAAGAGRRLQAGSDEQPVGRGSQAPATPVSSGVRTPEKSSVERRAIVEAVRPWAEKELGQQVIFMIDHLAVKDGFAFLSGRPLQPNGERIDYRQTRFREDLEQGFFDDQLSALIRIEDGRWTRVTSAIGATDVPWLSWPEEHGAPVDIFPGGFD